ncbi:thiolase family protein [Paraburkholderia silvatlantica]|uniref:Acetyl-CoA acetyltransferase n=1 Tax=Paraburkholderia silvatlantica TaxID=321895 RepID=A0A2U1A9V6_9BURK|nr:thiolase family protein [Paraburkholderia silvatlantica]MBB2930626.1 acetyl-CoA acetyltransferase [Paraburkholderia silvatlantica]PVY30427.1 acetyl-CoA acetyltransferase [Paraburkholderia silvatlantica]PXW36836.1 acetyl-CoA acetyltransferase [Paraburkholderia silvatlantica]PYE21177.1 acetyl-CoA acetyltransferase [Paraburkholderia silvatlantica]TDQ86682.1 acetyl-CoA acetyltransferase [Paraburkholderia silvatlantica]
MAARPDTASRDFAGVAIVAAAEVPYRRHAPDGTTTAGLLAGALAEALADAGLGTADVDGLGVASFTLTPDHAIDFGWRAGLRLRWCMDDCHGGASGVNLLQHAARAIQAGDAEVVVLVSGDHFEAADFTALVENYNATTRAYLRPLGTGGPNPLFAMLTQRQMAATGLTRDDYAALCIAQRAWAARNPRAVYREPLTREAYFAAPPVAEPLCRLDCVPVVSGANALVLAAATHRCVRAAPVGIRALRASYNFDHQHGDGLVTGLASIREALWRDAGLSPAQMDVVSVYDDYPAMIVAQLADLGFADPTGPDALRTLIHQRIATRALAVNPSGGQLSVGQAGAAGGMHGLVEAVTQLRGEAGERQVDGARFAVVSGYGMVQYRYGMCANAVVLERAEASWRR